MIPTTHIVLLGMIQFTVGLLGLILRRAGLVILVSILVMLNGVMMILCALTSADGSESQSVGGVLLMLIAAVALGGAGVLYTFNRFRRTVIVDDHDRMKH